ncbi:copper resistance protein NlpE N-terminal domain-containing protein [Dysgonomonas sp. Marseille-P4677]|uniref:copper resistance protein NlpE n=1 Tax=Dysgonomonas sp. Marseille-P4677 TaxID=2364790 RepID=UPI0019124C4E|nr:copper resistance protein NlpE [Dysgonomonas sp. Marseille-P4677]MBK5720444.1 copper resistance protein NlpE N-terminal domain-containing protein [Dysgonomonas sp. Marseille-P4677]
MKKLFVMIAAIGVLYSCGGNTQKQPEETASIDEFSEIAKSLADEHNARNSLDYQGTYKGTLPTASGEGMLVSIVLDDSTYTRNVEYIGKKNSSIIEKGKYVWNTEGNTITLEGADIKTSPNKYFVGENTLIQLDLDGNRITGDMAELYILRK